MMRRLVRWFSARSRTARLFISSLAVAVPFYFAALLSYLVAQVARIAGPSGVAVHAVMFVIMLTVIVAVARYFGILRDEVRRVQEERLASLLHAYTHVDRLTTGSLAELDASDGRFVETFVASVRDIQNIVQATYATFEAAFGKAPGILERIDFEVTFMTKSHKDCRITIPAFANREGRSPRSMILRQREPDLYDNTVTATVYREARPAVHIIENTLGPGIGYQELYPGQTERIRSSIIFPVLSDKTELLGTLVVHCDRVGFFRPEDRRYWSDLLEIFAKRIALVKAKLDALQEMRLRSPILKLSLPDALF